MNLDARRIKELRRAVDAAVAPLGGKTVDASGDYELFAIVGPGARLMVYQHQTTAGCHHARVMDQSSKDKGAAYRMWAALPHDGCTFSMKHASLSRLRALAKQGGCRLPDAGAEEGS